VIVSRRSDKAQIEELLHASKVSVFFIDDRQVVRPDEIGSADYILNAAAQNQCRVFDYRLEAQFRCSGSDGFINWVNNTLEIERTANVLWNLDEEFEFRIFDSPSNLESAVFRKIEEGKSARLTAGFCWPWSDARGDGTLIPDVVLDGFQRPWNAKPDARRLALGIPKATLWAYEAGGANQVGCIYTAQGFEFDYVGVIFGKDLVYRPGKGWIAIPGESYDTVVRRCANRDPERFLALIKNTYRVLTRGMKGCYVYFEDQQTREFFMSRTERAELES
jgi:uncharacterized protein